MADVATTEPVSIRGGDTLTFSRSLADYPAPTWTLAYSLVNASFRHTFTAAASGSDHLVTVAASTTATWDAGTYRLVGRVSSGAEVYTVTDIAVAVQASPATLGDTRTHARKCLDAIEAVLENRAAIDQESMAIQGRQLTRTPVAELLKLRSVYKGEVAREEASARLAAGLGGSSARVLSRI